MSTSSQFIGVTKRRRKKKKEPLRIKFSLRYSLLFFWILVFCLLLIYLISNPITRSKAFNEREVIEASLASGIPGLTYKELATYLRPLNIICQPALQTEASFTGVCEGVSRERVVDIRIQVSGSSQDRIDLLQASMTQYFKTISIELFQDVLGEIASVPHQGYKPQTTRQWVERTLSAGEAASEKFGDVPFHLEPNGPGTWHLSVGE